MATRRKFLGGAGAFVGALLLPKIPDLDLLEDAPPTLEQDAAAVAERWSYSDAALVASGGLCAPLAPYYDLPLVSSARPVRDSLPRFEAPRGGVTFPPPPGL